MLDVTDDNILLKEIELTDLELTKAENIKAASPSVKNINRIKVDKNYLFSKEATKLIVDNYSDLVIKSDFLNYLMENLTEYYSLADFEYIDSFLFPIERTSITDDIVNKVLNQPDSILFKYYLTKLFKKPDQFNYIGGLSYILKINPSLKPSELRDYYGANLSLYLNSLSIKDIENYYSEVKKGFALYKANLFISDFYNQFMMPAIQAKLREMPVNNMEELHNAVKFINSYQELKYNRSARILVTSYELLNSNDNYYTYDADIIYDTQDIVEKILVSDHILEYNLIYFCSYFDNKIYFKKSLNLIINILEGLSTISISKTKYEMIKGKTIDETLIFLEWVIFNHKKDTKTDEFRNAVKDFINYNWNIFNASNKSLIKLRASLRDYQETEKIIIEVRKDNTKGFDYFYKNHGPFVFSTLFSIIFFAICCYIGISFLSELLATITDIWKFVAIILAEIAVTGIFMLVISKDQKWKIGY